MEPFDLPPGTPISDVNQLLAREFGLRLDKSPSGGFTTAWIAGKPKSRRRIDSKALRNDVMQYIGARGLTSNKAAAASISALTQSPVPQKTATSPRPSPKKPPSRQKSKSTLRRRLDMKSQTEIRNSPALKKAGIQSKSTKSKKVKQAPAPTPTLTPTPAPTPAAVHQVSRNVQAVIDAVDRLRKEGVDDSAIPTSLEQYIVTVQGRPLTNNEARELNDSIKLAFTSLQAAAASVSKDPESVKVVPPEPPRHDVTLEEFNENLEALPRDQQLRMISMFPNLINPETAARLASVLVENDPTSVTSRDLQHIVRPTRQLRQPMLI